MTKVSKELWNKNDTRLPMIASWMVYAFVLRIAYGRFVWDGLKLEDLLTMWARRWPRTKMSRDTRSTSAA